MSTNIAVTNIGIKPNPVITGQRVIVSATIKEISYVLGDGNCAIAEENNKLILVPLHSIK